MKYIRGTSQDYLIEHRDTMALSALCSLAKPVPECGESAIHSGAELELFEGTAFAETLARGDGQAVVGGLGPSLSTSSHPAWIHPSAVSFYDSPEVRKAIRCKTRRGVLNLAIDAAWKRCLELKRFVLWLEFGVWKGDDITHIAGKLREKCVAAKALVRAAPVVHGFDSFEGLPSDWKKGDDESDMAFPKGLFDLQGIPPMVNGDNVKLHKGWFEDTVPAFLDETQGQHGGDGMTTAAETFSSSSEKLSSSSEKKSVRPDTERKTPQTPVMFVHADADLYSSTSFFLTQLFQRGLAVKGTVIVFDEFTNYDGWELDEYLAWSETCVSFGVTFEYLAVHAPKDDHDVSNTFKFGYQSVCVRILNVKEAADGLVEEVRFPFLDGSPRTTSNPTSST